MWLIDFFSVLGYQFFFANLVSPGSINMLRKYFHWNMLYCDPQVGGIPQSAFSIEFPLCCKFFSEKTTLKYFIKVWIRSLILVKEYSIETLVVFVPRVIILIVRNFQKVLSLLIKLHNQTFSSTTTGLISSDRASVIKSTHLEENLIRNHSFSSIYQVPDRLEIPKKLII